MRHELTPWQRELIVHTFPDPLAVLDLIERVNDLPDAQTEIRGTVDDGPAPDAPAELV